MTYLIWCIDTEIRLGETALFVSAVTEPNWPLIYRINSAYLLPNEIPTYMVDIFSVSPRVEYY